MKSDYDRKLTLLCPTCGSSSLSCHDDDLDEAVREYSCEDCGSGFNHQQLMDGNASRVSAAIEEIKSDVVADIRSSIKKMFK